MGYWICDNNYDEPQKASSCTTPYYSVGTLSQTMSIDRPTVQSIVHNPVVKATESIPNFIISVIISRQWDFKIRLEYRIASPCGNCCLYTSSEQTKCVFNYLINSFGNIKHNFVKKIPVCLCCIKTHNPRAVALLTSYHWWQWSDLGKQSNNLS